MQMTISRPVSSTQVSSTLSSTSPTPTEVDQRDQRHEAQRHGDVSPAPSPIGQVERLEEVAANAFDALDADVSPEHITVKVTMNVRKWMPNALCV